MSRFGLYFNTLRYLRPIQITSRISQKLKSKKKPILPEKTKTYRIDLMIPELDTDPEYVNRFNTEKICENRVVNLLNTDVSIDFSKNNLDSLKPLIRFNLQYFEYAIALGVKYSETGDTRYFEVFRDIYDNYLKADLSYAPYVISLHIPNIIISLELFGKIADGFKQKIDNELFRQYIWLVKHQERHLLGNHYFENLKAIIIASLYFGEIDVCRRYCQKLEKEIHEQILSDGFHFELSPMYHKIILEDLLRIYKISGIGGFPQLSWLNETLKLMTNAMCSLEKGFNRTPLFNDAGDNVAKTKECLVKTVLKYIGISLNSDMRLMCAGYYKLYDNNTSVIFDVGDIGPSYMTGHGHCDCLSFELTYDGTPLFVNSGTYEYQGDKRMYFRSTRAHNTLMIDDNEQSQCWGEHRVAKRIRNVRARLEGDKIIGSCVTVHGDKLIRELQIKNGLMSVLDSTETKGKTVNSFLRINDAFLPIDREGFVEILYEDRKICSVEPIDCSYSMKCNEPYSPDFGEIRNATLIKLTWPADNRQHGYKIKFLRGDKV